MVTLADLWLPILLSTVAVFFLSFLMWMVSPHHRSDWAKVPDEDRLMDAIRTQGLRVGQFTFPFCASPKDMRDPKFVQKVEAGPSGFLVLRPPGKADMGKSMAISAAFNLAVSILVAYVATIGLGAASSGVDVFRLTATGAFLGYSAALGWGAIWFARTWRSTSKEMLDGLVYGLATGALFALLWP
jgi:hypothetical protein